MEVRVARLEEQFTRIEALLRGIDDRVRRFELDAAELKGRIASLPTTWAMVTTMIGGQITLAGLVLVMLRAFGAK